MLGYMLYIYIYIYRYIYMCVYIYIYLSWRALSMTIVVMEQSVEGSLLWGHGANLLQP